MKIDEKILSLPPYISTAWQNVTGVFTNEGKQLEIHLNSGAVIKMPMPEPKIVDLIFYYHLQFIEKGEIKQKAKINANPEKEPFSLPFGMPFPFSQDNVLPFGGMMQHNPEQANMPEIPKELLDKVTHLAKAINPDTTQVLFPDAQPHCNCLYCQVGRAMNATSKEEAKPLEEPVTDDDLKFKEWDISKTGDALYEVKNPLNQTEIYQVYLGNPIGCTCGSSQCEHIKAVLSSEI